MTLADQDVQTLSFLQGINMALHEEMARDEHVIVMGQGVEVATYGMTSDLVERFGTSRVRDTPICEGTMTGMGVGAAMCGMRPFVDLTLASFLFLAFDQMLNQAAKNHFLFGGQAKVPVVFNSSLYYRSNSAAQHTDRPHPMLMNMPGLKIVCPQTPHDAKGLLKTAIRDDDPVMFLSDMVAGGSRGPVPSDDYTIPFGQAEIVREGTDVTVVPLFSLRAAMRAADKLAKEGISVEVVDPRTLAPLDWESIVRSVAKTKRAVVVDIAHPVCSAASEISVHIFEELFGELRAPVQRVCAPPVHVPYAPGIERQFFPDPPKIEAAIRRTLV